MPGDQHNADRVQTIGQVVTLLADEFPDVTHSSLRFLEREGLIAPDRTAGGHRLFDYSQIERIRSIKHWQRQRLSLEEIRLRLASVDRLPDVDVMSGELFRRMVHGDRHTALELVLRADDAGVPVDVICDRVLRPALSDTKAHVRRGELSEGLEREINWFVRDLVAYLGSRRRPEERAEGPAIVAACPEGEHDDLDLRMLAMLLRRNGYVVHYLGPHVARDALLERVKDRVPKAVLLAISNPALLPTLQETVAALARPSIIVGRTGVLKHLQGIDREQATLVAGNELGRAVLHIDRIVRGAGQHN